MVLWYQLRRPVHLQSPVNTHSHDGWDTGNPAIVLGIGRGFRASAYPYFFRERRFHLKKTENLPKAHKLYRLISAALIVLPMLCCMTISVLATPVTLSATSSATSLAEMNQKIYLIYLTIRNDIAFPLLSLSFASCGFKILGVGIISSGNGVDKGFQAAKEQILISACAMLFIFALPYIMSYAIRLFRSNAWVPGVILFPNIVLGGLAI